MATVRRPIFGGLFVLATVACQGTPQPDAVLDLAARGSAHIQADLVRAFVDTCCPVELNAGTVERCLVSVNDISRPGIYMQAPGLCRFPVFAHSGARFVSWITLTSEAWVGDGDGAGFLVSVLSSDPPETVLIGSRSLDPGNNALHRRWVSMEASLEPWAGMLVTLELRTNPGPTGDTYHDWCVWGEPIVFSPPLENARYHHPDIMDGIEQGRVHLDHDFLATGMGGSEITSPESSQPLVPISLRLGGEAREGLYAHPPWRVRRTVVPGPQARLVTSLGLVEECWSMSNGVNYVVEINSPGKPLVTKFRYWLCPQVNRCDRSWVDVVIDLSMYAGQTITLTLRTEGGYAGSLMCDSAAWAHPVVVSQ